VKLHSKRSTCKSSLRLLTSRNINCARRSWVLSREQVGTLKSLTAELRLSVARGDLRLIDGAWYVTHAGLMRLANRSRCSGIRVRPILEFCDPSVGRWVFETVVYKSSPALPKLAAAINNGNQNGHTRLRDRLCLPIRQHQLDANLVKAYAADSCGTPNLRDASREQIENFITNLADWATKDRPALLCKLNSYAKTQEVTS
jgi:hypothetical protein